MIPTRQLSAFFPNVVDLIKEGAAQGHTAEDYVAPSSMTREVAALKVIAELRAKYALGAVKIGLIQTGTAAAMGLWTLVKGPLKNINNGYQMAGRNIDFFATDAYDCITGKNGPDNACASPYRDGQKFSWGDWITMAQKLSNNIDSYVSTTWDSTPFTIAMKALKDADKTFGSPDEWPTWAKVTVGVGVTIGVIYALSAAAQFTANVKIALRGVDGPPRRKRRRARGLAGETGSGRSPADVELSIAAEWEQIAQNTMRSARSFRRAGHHRMADLEAERAKKHQATAAKHFKRAEELEAQYAQE